MTGKGRYFIIIFCSLLIIAAGTALVLNCGVRRQNAGEEREMSEYQDLSASGEYRLRAARIAASMDRNTLAAQVLLASVEGMDSVREPTRQFLSKAPPGGIILFGYNMSSTTAQTGIFVRELTQCIADFSVPPFIAADQEGGMVRRFRDRAVLPPPLSYWDKLLEAYPSILKRSIRKDEFRAAMEGAFLTIERDALAAGRELRQIGVTLNMAPVAETLTKKNRGVLEDRSYGPNQAFVIGAASAFVRGMEAGEVACTLKHFPGNSSDDPHIGKAVLNVSEKELDALVETFAETIRRENPAAVMLSHVVIPLWDTKPSSLSPHAVKRLRETGFSGIITADDYSMAAVGIPAETCILEALTAGVDMFIVWPRDLLKTHKAILEALDTGRLTMERLREAAERIIYQKLRYGLIR